MARRARFESRVRSPMVLYMKPAPHLQSYRNDKTQPVSAARIEAGLLKVATLVAEDASFAPVFERLEEELAAASEKELQGSEAQRRARALLDHKAMLRTSLARCWSDAPLP